MSFLYFLADLAAGVSAAEIDGLGLGYALGGSLHRRECDGPEGRHGTIAARSGSVEAVRVGYWPEKQTWRKHPGADAWIGFETVSPPGPADLIRPRVLPGHPLRLGDGRDWTVPVAVEAAGPPLQFARALPSVMDLDASGEWIAGEVVREYRGLWETATRWHDCKAALGAHLSEGQAMGDFHAEELEDRWIFDRAVEVLAANYHLGRVEAAMLGLFSSSAGMEVLDYLVDEPGYRAILAAENEQKKTADGSPSGDGSGG